jgi:hypothetical protein
MYIIVRFLEIKKKVIDSFCKKTTKCKFIFKKLNFVEDILRG